MDDANIYMAYGRNLAAGEGFVYYAGGERVEGFTSPAWTLITAAAFRIVGSTPELVLFVTSICLVTLTFVALLDFIIEQEPVERPLQFVLVALFCAWCLSSPAYAIWMTTSLMETPLWALVLCAGTVAFARLAGAAGAPTIRIAPVVCAGGAILVRPEALWIVPVWIAAAWLVRLLGDGHARAAFRAVMPAVVAFTAIVLTLTAFRLAYFGYPLSNTYYAKLSPSPLYNLKEGLGYLRAFPVSFPYAALAIVGSGVFAVVAAVRLWGHWLGQRTRALAPSDLRWVVVASSVLALAGVPLLTGGDHFAGFRVLQPIWPLFGLVLVGFLARIRVPRDGAVWRIIGGVTAVGIGASFVAVAEPSWIGDLSSLRHEYVVAARGRQLGQLLNEALPVHPRPSVGVIAAGGVATTYQGPIIDLMGLNTVKMGHSPGDRIGPKNHAAFSVPVFWDLQPDLLTPRLVENDDDLKATPSWLAERDRNYLRGLMRTPQFRSAYTLVRLRTAPDDEYPSIVAFCKRDWLAQHRAALHWSDSEGVNLQRDLPIQLGIAGAIHFAHAAGTNGRHDFVWAEAPSGRNGHGDLRERSQSNGSRARRSQQMGAAVRATKLPKKLVGSA